jgi:hypothetical protein
MPDLINKFRLSGPEEIGCPTYEVDLTEPIDLQSDDPRAAGFYQIVEDIEHGLEGTEHEPYGTYNGSVMDYWGGYPDGRDRPGIICYDAGEATEELWPKFVKLFDDFFEREGLVAKIHHGVWTPDADS